MTSYAKSRRLQNGTRSCGVVEERACKSSTVHEENKKTGFSAAAIVDTPISGRTDRT